MASRTITLMTTRDIRFPTSLEQHGSDAMHKDPDYSCSYVTVTTNDGMEGNGISFTLGRGNDLVGMAIKAMTNKVVGMKTQDIFGRFGEYWRDLTNDSQMRWLGPEKGVIHLAVAGIINALWDLWGKIEGKPVWKLLVDMEPEEIVSLIDFRHITDALTKEEAIEILRKKQAGKEEREKTLLEKGFPCYTTAAGWIGYSDDVVRQRCQMYMDLGFTKFKAKVGINLEDDKHRLGLLRSMIGPDAMLMTDANQRWDVDEAIAWMKELAPYNITWIEEPTSPDDVLGHKAISEALAPVGIKVATGEMCSNRVLFKQFLTSGALQYCQIDACRMGGVNEILPVILMAAKFNIPVCPHAGGVGLCELVQHMSMWDYVCVGATFEDRVLEYVDHLHEHFVDPVVEKNAAYMPPQRPGYSAEMKAKSLADYEYPTGAEWQRLFKEGVFTPPQ